MADELEPITSKVLYGDKGPDKYAFIMEGVLDDSYEGRDHEFTIDGRKMGITIRSARRLPAWQCPPHPAIDPERHDYEWAEAWEFRGYGNGCGILGIYSPYSRKGVYHFWPMHVSNDGCAAARENLQTFFAARGNSDALLALTSAMRHMVRGSAVGGHHVDCKDCWELFRKLRKSCELA